MAIPASTKPAKSLLVIDDDLSVRIVLKGVINYFFQKQNKITVFSAADGVEGLGHLFIDPPDLLIIDLTLPKYDGLEILDYIKTNKDLMQKKELPIIVLIQDHMAHQRYESNFTTLHKCDSNFTERLLGAIQKKLEITADKLLSKKNPSARLLLWTSDNIIRISDASDSVFQYIQSLPISLKKAFNRFRFLFLQLQISYLLLFFYWLTTKHQDEENIAQAHKDLDSLRVKAVPAVGVLVSSILFILLPVLLFGTTLFATLWIAVFPAHAANLTWDGGGTTNNWSDCANWSSDVCPTAIDSVVFNSTSTKDAVVDKNFGSAVKGISINAGYTGTISLARSFISTSGFTQSSGHFDAADQNMTISGGDFSTSADFTASSKALVIEENMNLQSNVVFHSSTGIIIFATGKSDSNTLVCQGQLFNTVVFSNQNTKVVSADCRLPLGNNPTLTGNGAIVLSGTLSGSGRLTKTAGSLEVMSSAVLSGFSGVTTSDASQNASADTIAPTGTVVINSGSSSTASQNILLTISASDNVTSAAKLKMKVSSTSHFLGASYVKYKTSKRFDFAVGNGTKTVYVKFIDEAGNESVVYSDSITYQK